MSQRSAPTQASQQHRESTRAAFDRYADRQRGEYQRREAPRQQPERKAPDPGQVLVRLRRNETTELVVSIGTFEGRRFLQLREWYQAADGAVLPGKKGLTIRRNELGDVITALERAFQELA